MLSSHLNGCFLTLSRCALPLVRWAGTRPWTWSACSTLQPSPSWPRRPLQGSGRCFFFFFSFWTCLDHGIFETNIIKWYKKSDEKLQINFLAYSLKCFCLKRSWLSLLFSKVWSSWDPWCSQFFSAIRFERRFTRLPFYEICFSPSQPWQIFMNWMQIVGGVRLRLGPSPSRVLMSVANLTQTVHFFCYWGFGC